ncbi:MAG: metallophosphoesterase [Myxococcaceae bacterium]|nr:metallophosphoesterase [Myxococcaceae bacterium]
MGSRTHVLTLRHPALATWQSVLHQVLARRHAPAGSAEGLSATAGHPAMTCTVGAAPEEVAAHGTSRAPDRPKGFDTCARLFVRLVLARFHGRVEEAELLQSELRFLTCDPLWAETWLEYERTHLRHAERFYRRHTSLDDFILPELPEKATVALLADWGTGMPDAQALLEQVAAFRPDVIVHLGDIYYSGTPHEVRAHFLTPFSRVFGTHPPRVYSLAGNHDRYSGGEGYRQLLEALGQPASYFCLRNRFWQLLAVDTGFHDAPNPRELAATLTRLEDSEVAWVLDKVRRADEGLPPGAGRRGTVLLSHHQLFTFAGVGHDARKRPLAVNPNLHAQLGPALPDVALWLWGHEHNVLVFEPYAGLQRGRCIGAGAVPNLVNAQLNETRAGLLPPPGESRPPRRVPGTRLGNDGVVDNHAYAILTLEGPRLTARYYQARSDVLLPGKVPPPGEPLYVETVEAPRG